jgi:hypothetical protein
MFLNWVMGTYLQGKKKNRKETRREKGVVEPAGLLEEISWISTEHQR